MILQEKVPGLNASYFLQKDVSTLKKELESALTERMDQIVFNSSTDVVRFEGEIIDLKKKLKESEDKHMVLISKLRRQSLLTGLLVFFVCFALVLAFLL